MVTTPCLIRHASKDAFTGAIPSLIWQAALAPAVKAAGKAAGKATGGKSALEQPDSKKQKVVTGSAVNVPARLLQWEVQALDQHFIIT